jgi:hypothetical protein
MLFRGKATLNRKRTLIVFDSWCFVVEGFHPSSKMEISTGALYADAKCRF